MSESVVCIVFTHLGITPAVMAANTVAISIGRTTSGRRWEALHLVARESQGIAMATMVCTLVVQNYA